MFKAILRSLLFSLLLYAFFITVTFDSEVYAGLVSGIDPLLSLLTRVGIVIVATTLSHVAASMLIPIKRAGAKRLFFGLSCLPLGFVSGIEIYLPTSSSTIKTLLPVPVTTILFWSFGYLLLSLFLRPTRKGPPHQSLRAVQGMKLLPTKQRGIPRALRRQLLPGEEALYWVRQTRWLYPLSPDTLLATDQRLLIYRPANLGFKSITESYSYIDIATIQLNCDWLFCQISMKERFQGQDLEFAHIPKRGAKEFIQHVTLQMRTQQTASPVNLHYPSALGRMQYEPQSLGA